jgi:hypothetical protein
MEKRLHPYLTAALLCEKVLQEKDGTLSIIRIADRVTYQPIGVAAKNLKPIHQMQGLVGLKSGPITGEHVLKIIGERPSGQRNELMKSSITLFGQDQGQNFILNLAIGLEEDGLHWFDVLLDDEVLTRIPLMVMRSEESIGTEMRP